MEKNHSTIDPFFYLNSSIPSYSGKEPLKKTILTTHQKRVLFYIRLLESDHPIPIFSSTDRISNEHSNTENMYFHTNYAFYADPICTGKSFVILSLLSLHRCVERKKLLTIWSNGLGMNVFSKIQNFEIPLSILVTPTTSLAQWDNLFKEETEIKYFIVDSEEAIDQINVYEYEVLIVSDIIFDKVCLQFQGFSVSRIIFDDLLHLEIKDIPIPPNSFPSNIEPGLFGNLRASFTWFVSSEPHACQQRYRKSRLPFAVLINQIFSFPYPGLVFRNEDTTLEQSLSVILPELEFQFQAVYIQKIEELNIESEIKNILSIEEPSEIYSHLLTLWVKRIRISFVSIKDLPQNKIETVRERYENKTDPVSYDKIIYPLLLPCCYQMFDILSLSKCLSSDMRCPFCRKETKWNEILGINKDNGINDQLTLEGGQLKQEGEDPLYIPFVPEIWNIIENINLKEYNVFYIPSLKKDISISKDSRAKIHLFIRELTKRYKCFVFSGKSNSKRVFEDFKNQKGILIIGKPIQANLHLSYVDKVYVLHPREYQCKNGNVWFSNYFKNYYSKHITIKKHSQEYSTSLMTLLGSDWNNRSMVSLTDHELGNFCIANQNNLNILFFKF
jgi:hypothetical protein